MPPLLQYHAMLPVGSADTAPEWIHLLPAGEFRGADGRGPYRVENANALILHSMQSGKLLLDENHAADRAAVTGGSAPAAGWIVELQSRDDGIWGRVDWTSVGSDMVAGHLYRGVSPAFATDARGSVTRIARASLTNLPNLDLTHLHSSQTENTRMDRAEVARLLGLPADATENDVTQALTRARDGLSLHARAAELAGVPATSGAEAIVTGLRARQEGVSTHAQQQIEGLRTQIEQLTKAGSAAWVEAKGRERVISDQLRDELVTLHAQNPDLAEKIVSGLVPVPDANVVMHTQGGAARATTQGGVAAELLAKMDAGLGIKADAGKEGK
ncbi:phage protease [Acetobacter sp. DsW_063]|uniref:phage protease n=1 Tax=Acetobacter sp. DsW_063 TaxID=1514894 RepID=UPI000A3BF60A|nr:phage protease [Acetobacter sp. DsW_063]